MCNEYDILYCVSRAYQLTRFCVELTAVVYNTQSIVLAQSWSIANDPVSGFYLIVYFVFCPVYFREKHFFLTV